MTDGNMFCFQCEQTAGCTACTGAAGVCGKTADVARLQDELTGALIALARAENGGKGDSESDGLMLEGMFACVSNVSFDPEAIAALERRVRAKAIALGEFDLYDMGELWDAQEDIRSLKSLLLFGMRGVAAYAYHAQALGKSDPAVTAFLYEGMRARRLRSGHGRAAAFGSQVRRGQLGRHGGFGGREHLRLRQARARDG